MIVEFWGVRGSHSCWGPSSQNVGGHTPCVSVRADQYTPPLILDAGSGVIPLGSSIKFSTDIHCFVTHAHLDHVMGLPFFQPLWSPEHHMHFYTGQDPEYLESVLRDHILSPPLFPVPYDSIPSRCSFHHVDAQTPTVVGAGVSVTSLALNHPGGASGYLVQQGDKKIAYLSDHEHGALTIKQQQDLAQHCRHADLIIFDTMYDTDGIECHRGWGHSTWEEACHFAIAADAKSLALFHLNPAYTDERLFEIEARAQECFSGAFLAKETGVGVTIK